LIYKRVISEAKKEKMIGW